MILIKKYPAYSFLILLVLLPLFSPEVFRRFIVPSDESIVWVILRSYITPSEMTIFVLGIMWFLTIKQGVNLKNRIVNLLPLIIVAGFPLCFMLFLVFVVVVRLSVGN